MNSVWWKDPTELDAGQQALFTRPLGQSALIVGPPGSGKTNILLLRASQMVLSGKPNILILVFTRTLREFIATAGSQYQFSKDRVQTLDRWRMDFLREQGIKPDLSEDYTKKRLNQLSQIQEAIKTRGLASQYQAIFLDEAQDYLPEELDIFFALGEVVVAAADSRQQIYPSVKDARDQLLARFAEESIHTLKHHYRNGHAICRAADSLAKSWKGYDLLMPGSNYNEAHYPSSLSTCQNTGLEAQVAEAVDQLKLQIQAYPGENLAVICPAKSLESVAGAMQASELAEKIVIQGGSDGYNPFNPDCPICICSVHGSKGLEFRAVHLIDTENIGKSELRRNITYMAFTRAKTSLTLHHDRNLPPYIEEALLSLSGPAPVASLDDLFKIKES